MGNKKSKEEKNWIKDIKEDIPNLKKIIQLLKMKESEKENIYINLIYYDSSYRQIEEIEESDITSTFLFFLRAVKGAYYLVDNFFRLTFIFKFIKKKMKVKNIF